MNCKVVAVFLIVSVYTASALVCPANYCASVRCANVDQSECETNSNGVFTQRGTWCGCCPACLVKLNEGESCMALMIRGVPRRVACAPGTTCDWKTHLCTKVEE